jgi:adenosine deaminase
VFRNSPKELVFAQALFGFELASADPRVVAINFVGEEDAHDAMTDYAEHMRMVGFLRTLYPDVRVSLHAGELAPGLVPPEGLCCHVRLAVESARTDRIGHGVDVMYEDQPYQLLKNMADKGVLVEINLTSNPRHQRQAPPAPDLSHIRRAGGALDRRRRHRADRPHA